MGGIMVSEVSSHHLNKKKYQVKRLVVQRNPPFVLIDQVNIVVQRNLPSVPGKMSLLQTDNHFKRWDERNDIIYSLQRLCNNRASAFCLRINLEREHKGPISCLVIIERLRQWEFVLPNFWLYLWRVRTTAGKWICEEVGYCCCWTGKGGLWGSLAHKQETQHKDIWWYTIFKLGLALGQ